MYRPGVPSMEINGKPHLFFRLSPDSYFPSTPNRVGTRADNYIHIALNTVGTTRSICGRYSLYQPEQRKARNLLAGGEGTPVFCLPETLETTPGRRDGLCPHCLRKLIKLSAPSVEKITRGRPRREIPTVEADGNPFVFARLSRGGEKRELTEAAESGERKPDYNIHIFPTIEKAGKSTVRSLCDGEGGRKGATLYNNYKVRDLGFGLGDGEFKKPPTPETEKEFCPHCLRLFRERLGTLEIYGEAVPAATPPEKAVVPKHKVKGEVNDPVIILDRMRSRFDSESNSQSVVGQYATDLANTLRGLAEKVEGLSESLRGRPFVERRPLLERKLDEIESGFHQLETVGGDLKSVIATYRDSLVEQERDMSELTQMRG